MVELIDTGLDGYMAEMKHAQLTIQQGNSAALGKYEQAQPS